ncbi:MAG: alpha/beta fold hydrolase [Gammaproteobacteria bacterium]
MSETVEFVTLAWGDHPLRIEYQWLGSTESQAPLIVFLHEGLGSLAMWKDFPARLCAQGGFRGLVFSRPGYGRSTPHAAIERWGVDFMHRQAYELLPQLLRALEVDVLAAPPWLLGHSDGGSIALLYAARYPERVAGVIALSPHIMVEELSIESIEKARRVYLETDLKARLGRYHDDPDSAFWGWNDTWLDPEFRSWSIESEIGAIECPLLAVQGLDDEYGTLAQIHGIAERAPQTEILELPDCGHSPQRDQSDSLLRHAVDIIDRNRYDRFAG